MIGFQMKTFRKLQIKKSKSELNQLLRTGLSSAFSSQPGDLQITSGLVSLSDEKAKERRHMIQMEMRKEYMDHMRRVCSSRRPLVRGLTPNASVSSACSPGTFNIRAWQHSVCSSRVRVQSHNMYSEFAIQRNIPFHSLYT